MNKTRQLRMIVALFALMSAALLPASAHPPFPAYVEHNLFVVFSKNYIDATVRFIFHQKEAEAVRRQIDADNNKRLTQDECQRFASQIANPHDWLKIILNNEKLKMVMLYDPAFESRNSDQINQTPFSCEVSFFAQTPQLLDANVFALEDSFMPETPALCIFSATAKSGAPLQDAIAADGSEKRLPLRIASPDLGSASRCFTLNLSKDHFAGEKP